MFHFFLLLFLLPFVVNKDVHKSNDCSRPIHAAESLRSRYTNGDFAVHLNMERNQGENFTKQMRNNL